MYSVVGKTDILNGMAKLWSVNLVSSKKRAFFFPSWHLKNPSAVCKWADFNIRDNRLIMKSVVLVIIWLRPECETSKKKKKKLFSVAENQNEMQKPLCDVTV